MAFRIASSFLATAINAASLAFLPDKELLIKILHQRICPDSRLHPGRVVWATFCGGGPPGQAELSTNQD